MIHISEEGDVIWKTEYNMFSGEVEIVQDILLDGEYLVIVGNSEVNNQSIKNFIFRININNRVVDWAKTYEGSQYNTSFFFKIRDDIINNQYLMFGQTQPNQQPGLGCDAAYFRINKIDGSIISLDNYNLGSCEYFRDIVLYKNNSIYAAGRFNAAGGGLNKMRGSLTKLDLNENEIWSKLYSKNITSDNATLFFLTLVEENDHIYMGGFGDLNGTSSTNVKMLFIKTDMDGNLVWQKEYDIPNANPEILWKIISSPDGFILVGEAQFSSGKKAILIKTNKNGDILSANFYGSSGNEKAGDIIFSKGSLVLIGTTSSYGNNQEIFYSKLDINGNLKSDNCNFQKNLMVLSATSNSPFEGRVNTIRFKNNFNTQSKNIDFSNPALSFVTHCNETCIDTCLGGYSIDNVPDLNLFSAEAFCIEGSTRLLVKICNQSPVAMKENSKISIYTNNPSHPGTALHSVLNLDKAIPALGCIDFVFESNLISGKNYYIIANDDGTTILPLLSSASDFRPYYPECNLENNILPLNVNFENSPLLDLGPDKVICSNSVTELETNYNFNNYLWSTGERTKTITAFNEGLYWVEATDECGRLQRDSIFIRFEGIQSINLPDTIKVCQGDSATIQLSGFTEYQWFPGSFFHCADCPVVTVFPTIDTTLTVVAKSAAGCYSEGKTFLKILAVSADSSLIRICSGDSIQIHNIFIKEAGHFPYFYKNVYGCDSLHIYQVEVNDDTIRTASMYKICEGDSLMFENIWYHKAGIYILQKDKQGCTEVHTLTLEVTPVISVNQKIQFCSGDTVIYLNRKYGEPGFYSFIAPDSLGCDNVYYLTLENFSEMKPVFDVVHPCPNQNNGSVTITYPGNPADFRLYINGFSTSQSVFTDLKSGSISFEALDHNGCRNDTVITLQDQKSPDVEFIVAEPLCTGQSNGTVKTYDSKYEISLSPQFLSDSYSIDSVASGTYRIFYRIKDGCIWDTLIEVPEADLIEINLAAEVTIVSGSHYQIIPSHNLLNPIYRWSPPDGLSCTDCPNPVAQPIRSTEYTVTVTDENGCQIEGRILLEVESGLYYPNIFRPGSENGNQKFIFISGEQRRILELKIFDRWGNMVFSISDFMTNDEHYGWDGTFEGRYVESGVYTGYVRYLNLSGDLVTFSFNTTVLF